MGIGTSDGKYYPSEMDMALDEMSSDLPAAVQQEAQSARDAAAKRLSAPYLKQGGEELPMLHREYLPTIDLDPTGGDLPGQYRYDDTPTPQQRARDGSIYNNLKQQEQSMEQRLETYKADDTLPPTGEPIAPVTPISDNGGWGPRPKDLPDNIEWAPNMDRVRDWHSDPDSEYLKYENHGELKKLVPEGYEGYITEMSDGQKFLLRRPAKKEKPPLTS